MIWVDLKQAEIDHFDDMVLKFPYKRCDVIEVCNGYNSIDSRIQLIMKAYPGLKISAEVSFRGVMNITENEVLKAFEMIKKSLGAPIWCMSFLNTNIKFQSYFDIQKWADRMFKLKRLKLVEKVKLNYTEIDAEEDVWKEYLDRLMRSHPYDYLKVETDECYQYSKKYKTELIRSYSSVYASEKKYEKDEIDFSLPHILIRKEHLR